MEQLTLHKKTLTMWRLGISVVLFLIVFIVSIFMPIGQLWWWIVVISVSLLFLLAFLFYLPMYFNSTFYWIDTKCIRVEKGVLFRTNSTMPYSSIQYATVISNPVEKIFGLASIRIVCAGGSFFLSGFSKKRASDLLTHFFIPLLENREVVDE